MKTTPAVWSGLRGKTNISRYVTAQ